MREIVIFDEKIPGPPCKKRRSMDDLERHRKEVGKYHLRNARRLVNLTRRFKKGEDVREEVTNHIREMLVHSVLG